MRWTFAIVWGLAVIGCESETPPPAPSEPVAAPEAQPAPAPPVKLSDDDVAVPEDFIEEATAEVTAENYTQKLQELEKEVFANQE